MKKRNIIIAGSGIAGCTAARVLADAGFHVTLLEERPGIGGNCRDDVDRYGIRVHPYGPHIFHTDDAEVYRFLSRFATFQPYAHEVLAATHEGPVVVPFNFNSLKKVFGEESDRIKEKLLAVYGAGSRVGIRGLMESGDKDFNRVGRYVYENIYLYYTMKQWGKKPEEIDPKVTDRVPVVLDADNGYFRNRFQGMPEKGYTDMFEKMLDHPDIEIYTETPFESRVALHDGEIYLDGELFDGEIIYTGPADRLLGYRYGHLPYRTLTFAFEHYDRECFQDVAVVNYTVSEAFTRITEFKLLTGQKSEGTTILKEYPKAYEGKEGEVPCYVIQNETNRALYEKYRQDVEKISGVHLLGRLAEYRYYDMDSMTRRAMDVAENIIRK